MSTLARPEDVRLDLDRMAAAAFLASYREPTRSLYTMNLRQWFTWCSERGITPLEAQRAHLEVWARELEEVKGLKVSTVANKLNTLSRFYRTCLMDRLITNSPAEFLRKPKVPRQSTTNALTRSELLAVLDAAQASTRLQDHAFVAFLAFTGLRIGEVCKLDVEHLGRVGGYRTIDVTREKRNRAGMIPLAPRASWALDLWLGDRTEGPLFCKRYGERLDRKAGDRIIQRTLKAAGVTGKRITPHSFRHSFMTLSLDAGVSVRDMVNSMGYSDSKMITYYDRNRESLPRHAAHMMSAYVEGS